MSFVHPYLLYALAAIAIPIIIHLFNFRRYKKVLFTNIRFIEQVRKKTKKRSQLKHLLVLSLRILAIACLVIAFAQPYIPVEDRLVSPESLNLVSVYIDNSFSMQAKSKSGSLLDEAKKIAEEIALAFRQSDVFYLATNDFSRQNQRWLNREEFIEAIGDVDFSPSVKKLDDVLARQADFLHGSPEESKIIFLVSDFQESIVSFDGTMIDTNSKIFLVPLMAEQSGNVYIDSCWFENPFHQLNQQSKLAVRIKNASDVNYEKVPVKLNVNGSQKAVASFDIIARGMVDLSIPYTHHEPGSKKAKLEITDYPVTYDDAFYFVYHVQEVIPVLSIYHQTPNTYLKSFFNNDSAFQYQFLPAGSLNYAELQYYNLIILDHLPEVSTGMAKELQRYVEKGGSLVVIPPPEIDHESYHRLTQQFNACTFASLDTVTTRISRINTNHLLFQDVFEEWPADDRFHDRNIDLPLVMKHYPLQYPGLTLTEKLLVLSNDRDFLNVIPFGKGELYLFASPVDPLFTSLPKHAIFVPLLYRMALISQPYSHTYYTLGEFNDVIELSYTGLEREQVLKVMKGTGNQEFIPEHRNMSDGIEIVLHGQIREAGHYSVMEGDQEIAMLAFNFDRRESDLTLIGESAIMDRVQASGYRNIRLFSPAGKPVSQTVRELNEGIRLWKLFIIFVLIFLAAESFLLRIWK